jgi:hypothetical protein
LFSLETIASMAASYGRAMELDPAPCC